MAPFRGSGDHGPVARLTILLSLQVVLVGACAFLDDPGASSSAGTGAGRSTEAGEPSQPDTRDVLTGTLGFIAVEGGCAYIEASDGRRYEVLYPGGWVIDRATGRLHGPDGQTANLGAVISLRGSVADDMVSTCQVGIIFRAVEVLRVAG